MQPTILRALTKPQRSYANATATRFGKTRKNSFLHRLPLGAVGSHPTVFVRTASGIVDAREASDLIAKLSGKASWRKLYVRRGRAPVTEARALAASFG